jgi:hypothetical protein
MIEQPKIKDNLGYTGTLDRFRENRTNDIWYKEFHCTGCDIRYLVKVTAIRPLVWSLTPNKSDKELEVTSFSCHRCNQRWAIMDDIEIIDVY